MSFSELFRVVDLTSHNTWTPLLATTLLGAATGMVGSFLLLRKRSLIGDTLSHACLPGIYLAFLVLSSLGYNGKSLPGLLTGATITGLLGVGMVMAIRRTTRVKDDAAMGIVLSVFFGLGMVLRGFVQEYPANSSGLNSFIFGKVASMVSSDLWLIGIVSVVALTLCAIAVREFTLICFDEAYAASLGWSVGWIDALLLGLVTAVTVVGLQSVGLILIIAYLITPATAARFWTHNMTLMLTLSAVIGALSGAIGAYASALAPNLPAGAIIVLAAGALFLFSMLFGTARGVLPRTRAVRTLRRKMGRQHLLRSAFEILESRRPEGQSHIANEPIRVEDLLKHRSWSPARLRKLVRQSRREDHTERYDGTWFRLSESGFGEAARHTRNHRLWEMYLIRYADVAPGHVDRGADAVEHVLGADLVRQLEADLLEQERLTAIPASPHEIATDGALI